MFMQGSVRPGVQAITHPSVQLFVVRAAHFLLYDKLPHALTFAQALL